MEKKKFLVSVILLLLIVLSVVTFVVVKNKNSKKNSGTEIETPRIVLDKESYQLKVDDRIRLYAKVVPTSDEEVVITWESTNEKVATVNKDGLVEAKKVGTTNIIAKADGIESGVCEIIVSDEDVIEVKELNMSESSLSLVVGDEETLEVQIRPENATDKVLNWNSSNEEIVEVDQNGKIKAKKKGSALIEVTSVNRKRATCKVEVKEKEEKKEDTTDKPKETKPEENQAEIPSAKPEEKINVSTIKFYNDDITMLSTDTDKMHLVITPENATEKQISWTSSNPKVATVDQEGKIKAVSKGETTITATAPSGVKATGKVTVKHNILIIGDSHTYRPEGAYSKHRIATQFLRMVYEGGYIDEKVVTSTHLQYSKPVYIEDLGKNKTATVIDSSEATIAVINGTSLIHKMGILDEAINKERYDIVIIEEGKTRVLTNDIENMTTGINWVFSNLKSFNGVVYFRTNWPNDNSDINSYENDVNTMVTNMTNMARNYNGIIILDGKAALEAKKAGINIFNTNDNSHFNTNGAYVVALCMQKCLMKIQEMLLGMIILMILILLIH